MYFFVVLSDATCWSLTLPCLSRLRVLLMKYDNISILIVVLCCALLLIFIVLLFCPQAGSTATYSTHWLDTIKVKMQASPTSYTGGVNCLQKTLRNEGLRGLYQGATPAVAGHACKASIVFMCYGACERVVLGLCGYGADRITVTQHAAAGAMTGVLASFVLCPMELVKCRMQAMTEVHISSSDKLKAK